jgi:hypothetical protein
MGKFIEVDFTSPSGNEINYTIEIPDFESREEQNAWYGALRELLADLEGDFGYV